MQTPRNDAITMSLTENFKSFLENIPQGILEKEKESFVTLSDDKRERMIEFAKMAYPQIYAYMKIFNTCCRIKEEIGIHKFIKDEGVRARFDKFLHEGGDIEKIRQNKVEEEYLSASDMAAFKEAEREVHAQVHVETREEINKSRKAEFDEFVKEGEARVRLVQEKIGLLRQLSSKLPDWQAEILSKADEMDERWANFGNEPTEADLAELLEYYNSVAEVES